MPKKPCFKQPFKWLQIRLKSLTCRYAICHDLPQKSKQNPKEGFLVNTYERVSVPEQTVLKRVWLWWLSFFVIHITFFFFWSATGAFLIQGAIWMFSNAPTANAGLAMIKMLSAMLIFTGGVLMCIVALALIVVALMFVYPEYRARKKKDRGAFIKEMASDAWYMLRFANPVCLTFLIGRFLLRCGIERICIVQVQSLR